MSQDSPRSSLELVRCSEGVTTLEFGAFRIDMARHLVTRSGTPVPLTPKSYELLVLLVKRGGRMVSKQELMSALWPDTFVEETNLTFQVSALRKALGADHAWIETVPKYGYRLSSGPNATSYHSVSPAHVALAPQAPVPDMPDASASASGTSGTVVRWPIGRRYIIATAMILAAGAGWYALLRRDLRAEPAWAGPAVPLTAYVGEERAPSLSPDGSQVAFSWEGQELEKSDLWVKLVGEGEPVRVVAHPAFDESPAWSPDGRRLAFLRLQHGRDHEVLVVPSLGGTERHVAFVSAFFQIGVKVLSWTPDGRWIAIGVTGDDRSGIWLLEADGTGRRRLTHPEEGAWDVSPVFTRDEPRVAFIRRAGRSAGAVFVMPLDASYEPRAVPMRLFDFRNEHPLGLAWLPGGRGLLVAVSSALGSSRMLRLDLASDGLSPASAPASLPFGEHATALDVSSSGRVVYGVHVRDTDLRRVDLESGPSAAHGRLVQSTRDEHAPHFSPDGSRLSFVSTRSGSEEIWVAGVDGSGARQLTRFDGTSCSNPRWSPDATQIAFDADTAGSSDVYLLDPSTAAMRRVTDARAHEMFPRWSRDGRFLYFSSNMSGRPEIWRMPWRGGSAVQVTQGGGAVAEESHDGTSLIFTRPGFPPSLWRMPVGGGDAVLLADDVSFVTNFVVGRDAVYFVAVQEHPYTVSLEAIDMGSGARRTVAPLGSRWWMGLTLSPDERMLVLPTYEMRSDIMVAEPRE